MYRHAFRLAVLSVLMYGSAAAAKVTVVRDEHGAAVKIDDQPFFEYRTLAGHGPALYPVIGPTGKPVTRTFPFGPPGETKDHPHHQSFWMTHGLVNDVDFWRTNLNDDMGNKGPHIAHREFLAAEGGGDVGKISTRNDWMNADKRCCEDERDLVFGADPNGNRWIDFTEIIRAPDADVTFGDTKEGAFALRVVDSMRVDAKTGGRIVNSEGLSNEDAWGMPARWVDYTGPVDGETVGIAIMAHPSSFRPKPRWHVRTYGLFAVNPFGQKEFPHPEAAEQGAVTIKKGDSITLRYLVWLHKGSVETAALENEFSKFSK